MGKKINNKKISKSESITDDIVRDYFKQYEDDITIERQSSQNPSIDKLLQNASKGGLGKGYPDVIIQYNKNKNFIIIIENKADKTKHDSKSHKEYSDYAVDGVLLYASYLSKSYDVLAIAVSGSDEKDLKISHYLHLKDEPYAVPFLGDTFLSINEYYNAYQKSPEKTRQDYNSLLEYTSILNSKMHSLGINESDRSILVSCILLALRIEKFKEFYLREDDPEILTNNMVDVVLEWLKKERVGDEKRRLIQVEYDKIKVKAKLTKEKGVLQELIKNIDENLNTFIETHRYYDTLGELYVEFLRYANADKGLGIVLTPPHITAFFAKIANVNKHSVVFDNCTGTCGFLIAAMSKMIEDAKNDLDSIKRIKQKQLIGIEKDEKMFCLASSNMAIHQDGKTSIIYGSGLDSEILAQIKLLKPTVGMLNPPYKADKKNDIEELEFVKKNLDTLADGALCIAIVPMQSAISVKGKIGTLKKEILEKHTLNAVFSMPDELFYNSDVGVVTCIMIFTAHKAHASDQETFFGYFKNDGFEKRKRKGRIDVYGKWPEIEKNWLYLYKNKKEKAGLSVNKIVTAEDEWCAEAYMQTDYSTLCEEDFIKKLKEFSSFKFLNNIP